MTQPPPDQRPLKIVLISPKGPLYRRRGGIFRQSLRYMPLTLPTLAALVPDELHVELVCIDEGIDDVDLNLRADLIGMTVITGTANRAYELSGHYRRRGIPVVLGGPHVTLIPDDAQRHADSIVVGYSEETWPKKRYLTSHVFEATRGCVHNCSFCVVPAAWGRRPLQKPVEEIIDDIRRQKARRAIFVDLNLIADKRYAAALFEALMPLEIQWYGLATTLLCDDEELLDLVARSGCRGLLMGLESISPENLSNNSKSFNNPERYPEVVEKLHRRRIALQGCFVFGLDDDRPDVFLKTAQFAVDAKIDLPRFAIVTPFPGTGLYHEFEQQGRLLTQNWELYDGQHVVFQPAQMSVDELQRGTEAAWKYAYSGLNIARRLRYTGPLARRSDDESRLPLLRAPARPVLYL